MPIREHPPTGTVLLCDFSGFIVPEMVKRRPCVVLSPNIRARPRLCTVIAMSTSEPKPVMTYHCQVDVHPALPSPWASEKVWIKADMIYAVSFERLDFFRSRDPQRSRHTYQSPVLSDRQMVEVRKCVLRSIGLSNLTRYL